MGYDNALQFQAEEIGVVSVRNIMVDIDGTNLEEGIEIVSMSEMFEPVQLAGFDVNDLTTEEVVELIQINVFDLEEEKAYTKKFKVGFYFETEIEVRAYEGDHERIAEDGCDATLEFHAGQVSNDPDDEGLSNWEAPYHKEFKVIRPDDAIQVMVMGAIVLINMNKGEKYIPEEYHKQIAADLQEDILDGTLHNDSLDEVGSWGIKYRE